MPVTNAELAGKLDLILKQLKEQDAEIEALKVRSTELVKDMQQVKSELQPVYQTFVASKINAKVLPWVLGILASIATISGVVGAWLTKGR